MENEKVDLIDRGALLKKQYNSSPLKALQFVEMVVDVRDIEDAPTVDAVPVVYGRWIYHECVSSYEGAISGYSCSECNAFVNEEIFDMDEFHKDFCGHCGAKMDGGNEDG